MHMRSYANAIIPKIEGVNKLEIFKLSVSFLALRRTPNEIIKKIERTLNNTHATKVSAIPRNTR